MSQKSGDIKDAPIPDQVDPPSIKESLKNNNYVNQFSEEGTKLLEQTNRPNVITVAQFMPFIALFQMSEEDKARYQKEHPRGGSPVGPYGRHMFDLYQRYIRELEINLHQPTIVIRSNEDPVEELVLPRLFTRIKPDHVETQSFKSTIPSSVARNASMTRDQMLLNASLKDLVQANKTPEQMRHFTRMQMESALIEKAFVERNMSPERRDEIIGKTISSDKPSSHEVSSTYLDDDD